MIASPFSALGLPRTCSRLGAVLLILAGVVLNARAQAPLFLINDRTQVRKISMRSIDHQTLLQDDLRAQMATTAPGFLDRVKKILPLLTPAPHPFNPVELQKDVVRLRRYYNQNGFLHPSIDYPASQLDTASNTIHILFAIEEGPPLIIQDFGFFGPDGRYAAYQFPDEVQEQWIDFREHVAVRTGDRYTEFDRFRIRDETLTWLKNRGFAFATVEDEVTIDSTFNTIDVRYEVDTGPLAYFGEIDIEGNTSVEDRVIRRELPFKSGQRFSSRKLADGQRELFSLDMFRLALGDVPQQEPDTSVRVLYRVREARLRYLSARTGYASDVGVVLQGQWTHRNFLGGARTLTLNLATNTGIWASNSAYRLPPRLLEGSASLRQPYLFTTKLSGTVTPFVQFERDPQLLPSDALFEFNRREFGVRSSLLYELYPFRTVTAAYTFSLARTLTKAASDTAQVADSYNKSLLSLNATLGKVNNFLNPRRGFLIRPFVESAGPPTPGPGLEYFKASTEVVGYLPLTRRVGLSGRLFAGRLWPYGRSEQALDGKLTPKDSVQYEDRFDQALFYAGGSNDVRGWATGLAGAKIIQQIVRSGNDPTTNDTLYAYEAVGGRAKLGGNIEVRMPIPGLSQEFQSAVFLDFAQVSNRGYNLSNFKYGTGAGVRYETLIGYIRLDVGFKVNPDPQDLQDPEDFYRYTKGLTAAPPDEKFLRRFNVHISIGQAF